MEELYLGIARHLVEECGEENSRDLHEWIVNGSHFLAAQYVMDLDREDDNFFVTCIYLDNFDFLKQCINYRGPLGQGMLNELLIVSVGHQSFPTVKYFISLGADPTSDNFRALLVAARYNNFEMFDYLYKHRPLVRQHGYLVSRDMDPDVSTDILRELFNKTRGTEKELDLKLVHLLIAIGADPNIEHGILMKETVIRGDLNELKFMVGHGGRLRENFYTLAFSYDHPPIVAYLQDQGVPLSRDVLSDTFGMAIRDDRMDVISFFVEDLKVPFEDVKTDLLSMAAKEGKEHVVEYLVKHEYFYPSNIERAALFAGNTGHWKVFFYLLSKTEFDDEESIRYIVKKLKLERRNEYKKFMLSAIGFFHGVMSSKSPLGQASEDYLYEPQLIHLVLQYL